MIAPEGFSADPFREPAGPLAEGTGSTAGAATVRAEVVAQGLVLAADKQYPSRETLREVCRSILGSPEWSENAC